MEEKLRETEKEEFTKASSIRTFGDKPDSQHQARLRQGLPDDSERDSITYYEEKHTLKREFDSFHFNTLRQLFQ
jgi:hypothetical protein